MVKLVKQQVMFDNMFYRYPGAVKELVKDIKSENISIVRVMLYPDLELVMTYDDVNIYVCSDTNLCSKRIVLFYKMRWKIEELFRLLKQEFSLKKVYFRRITSQAVIIIAKLLSCIIIQVISNEDRRFRKLTYKERKKKLKNMFNNSLKNKDLEYIELMKYRFAVTD